MSNEEIRREAVRCTGRVQGVGFRYRASHAAGAAGVTGWVRNNSDGSVSMELQGTEAQIDRVLETVGRGFYVLVEHTERQRIPLREHEYGFAELDDE